MTRKSPRPGPAPDDDKKRRQEEFQREQEASRRQQLEGRRGLGNVLKFWQFCPDPRCKRANRCAGDVEVCFGHFWPHVPEDLKNTIRQTVKFASEGMPPRQAAAAAIDYVAQRKRIDEETMAREAVRAAQAPTEPAPAPVRITRTQPPPHAGPRIRGT